MPWSRKQVQTARAVAHGWKPKGSAKDFDPSFAQKVLDETAKSKMRKVMKVQKSR